MSKVVEKKAMLPKLIVILICVLMASFNIFFLYSVVTFSQFNQLNQWIFVIISVLVWLFLMWINLYICRSIFSGRAKKWLRMIIVVLVMNVLGGFLSLSIYEVDSALHRIVNAQSVQHSYESSFVVVNAEITSVDDLSGKRVGLLMNHEHLIGYDMPKNELETLDLDVEIIEFSDEQQQLQALLSGYVDAVALPSNYKAKYQGESEFALQVQDTQMIHVFEQTQQHEVELERSDIEVHREPFSLLVIGLDEGLSDALIYATVNPISLKVTMTSIPRDSYVPIACDGGEMDKIAHARGYGLQCTIDTVEDLLDVPVDFYVETNFDGVVSIVDELGGIVVYNEYEFVGQDSSAERGHFTVWVPGGGYVNLNGEQALAFARERKLYYAGDYQRQANQQQVIEAILNEGLAIRDVNVAMDVLRVASQNVSTNMSLEQMMSLFNSLMIDIERSSVPTNHLFQLVGLDIDGEITMTKKTETSASISIVDLYEESIEANTNAMRENLQLERNLDANTSMKWSAEWQ